MGSFVLHRDHIWGNNQPQDLVSSKQPDRCVRAMRTYVRTYVHGCELWLHADN